LTGAGGGTELSGVGRFGSALSKPGIKKDAGETLREPLMPPQPAHNSKAAVGTRIIRANLAFNFTER